MGSKHPAIELIMFLPWNAQDQLTCYPCIHNGSIYTPVYNVHGVLDGHCYVLQSCYIEQRCSRE